MAIWSTVNVAQLPSELENTPNASYGKCRTGNGDDMSFTYDQLKQAIQDYTGDDETTFVNNLDVFIRQH